MLRLLHLKVLLFGHFVDVFKRFDQGKAVPFGEEVFESLSGFFVWLLLIVTALLEIVLRCQLLQFWIQEIQWKISQEPKELRHLKKVNLFVLHLY